MLHDGGLHWPTAQELANVDVIVSYKGDSGYMTASEKSVLEDYLKRGGGLVAFHDTICAEDPEWFSTIYGGATLSYFQVWAYQIARGTVGVGDPLDFSRRLDNQHVVHRDLSAGIR